MSQNFEDTVLSWSGPIQSEKSQMSQSRLSVAGQSQFRKHRSPRILPNQVRETSSIPVCRVRKDVLFDQGHAVLPSPASKSYFRCRSRSKSRRCQHFRELLGSRGLPGIPWLAGSSGRRTLVVDSTARRSSDSPSRSSRPMRSARSLVARNGRAGSSLPSRSGRGSGPRRSSGDEATETLWRSFATSPTKWIS